MAADLVAELDEVIAVMRSDEVGCPDLLAWARDSVLERDREIAELRQRESALRAHFATYSNGESGDNIVDVLVLQALAILDKATVETKAMEGER
jgi:hypothetical protein